MTIRPLALLITALWLAVWFCCPQAARGQESAPEVPFCELANNPKAFDGKTIRVRGILSVRFEDFSLFSRDCKVSEGPWLAFGGDVPGVVASTANDNFRKPGTDVTVNDVSYGIKKDDNFRKLYALISARNGNNPEYQVTATLTGNFFAKKTQTLSSGQTVVDGYGHLGCCSLFVITEVADVVSDPPAHLTLRGTVSGPDGKPLRGVVVFDDVEGGSPPQRQFATTDANGNFEFTNSGQLLRFEDPRYRPLAVAVQPGGAPIHLRIEDANQSDWIVGSCRPQAAPTQRIGFSVLFTLRPNFQSTFDGKGNIRSYTVLHRGGDQYDPDLAVSAVTNAKDDDSDLGGFGGSEERWMKDQNGRILGIDSSSRGPRFHQRALLFVNQEYAGYHERSGRRAKALDRILDSACLAK